MLRNKIMEKFLNTVKLEWIINNKPLHIAGQTLSQLSTLIQTTSFFTVFDLPCWMFPRSPFWHDRAQWDGKQTVLRAPTAADCVRTHLETIRTKKRKKELVEGREQSSESEKEIDQNTMLENCNMTVVQHDSVTQCPHKSSDWGQGGGRERTAG